MVQSQFHQQYEISPGCHAHTADIYVTITDHHLRICSKDTALCAFVLFNPTLLKKHLPAKQQVFLDSSYLVESFKPILHTLLKKEVKIVGWSQNLLQNASGEQNSMVHWNAYGDWTIDESGHGTKKAFITSHMRCTKQQEVDLTEFFCVDYLDTSPDIQVSEWYREGVCGGGFYSMTASLMDENGTIMKQFTTGEIGKIYENNEWQEVSVTFSDYGPRVRGVAIESYGKDDKYWNGHYGTLMSAAMVRVKRESRPADNDVYDDINLNSWLTNGQFQISELDKILAKLLKDNNKLMVDNFVKDIRRETEEEENRNIKWKAKKQKLKFHEVKKQREVRLYVSSTFKDVTKEREELIKKTFQELNQECMDRRIFFSYVDLRWGISQEQNQHEKTIANCLQEIERCRPYFISLMGEKFGWSQREDKPDIVLNESFNYAIEHISDLKWLEECRYGVSVTQLEIQNAVLNDVIHSKERSFFYLRDPPDTHQIDNEEYKVYLPESEWHKERQQSLKNLILSNKDLNSKKYKTTSEVCEFVKKDIIKCLEKDFPQGSELSELEERWQAHQAFADVRRHVYVGGDTYFQQIDDFMETSQNPIVILGESGCGKSSLLANWCFRLEQKEPDTFIFLHFIGSSPESCSSLKMLHRLYEELKVSFGLEVEIPFSDVTILQNLTKWLKLVGTRRKCVLVFDALNHLDSALGRGNTSTQVDLSWISLLNSSKNVNILLSTLPGKVCKNIKDFGWPCIQIEPLTLKQKSEIIDIYFQKTYGKTLSSEQRELIVAIPQSDNPLFLRALLDEIRIHGDFSTLTTLTTTMHKYVIASCPRDLFCMILARLEKDFNDEFGDTCNVVRETTSAIWCSRKGMSEDELRKLVNIPSAKWSPFYLCLVGSLVNRNGIYNFFHDYLRQAVEVRFLPTLNDKKIYSKRLASFFALQPMSFRVAEELPFLLYEAGEMESLKETLSDLNLFQQLMVTEHGKYDLIHYWKLFDDFNEVSKVYKEQLEYFNGNRQSEDFLKLSKSLAQLFIDLSLLDNAKKLLESLLHDFEKKYGDEFVTIVYCPWNFSWKSRCCHETVIELLQLLGSVCTKQNDLEQAETYYRELLDRLNSAKTWKQKLQLCEGCLGLATVFQMKNNTKESEKLLLRSLELASEVFGPKHHYVATIINKLGQLCFHQGQLDKALCYFLQDFRLTYNNSGWNYPRLAGILNDVALVYDEKNLEECVTLYECALAIMLNMYGTQHVDTAMIRYNLGTVYFASNHFARAKYQWQEAVKVFECLLGVEHHNTVAAADAVREVTVLVNSN